MQESRQRHKNLSFPNFNMSEEHEFSRGLPESVMIFGCGYVGCALAKVLVGAGVRVGALTRNPEKAQRLRELGLAQVVVDELDSDSWHSEVGDYQAVVNCVSSAGGGLAGYEKSYIGGQHSILQWAKGRGVQAYLYTSSTSVYPQDGGARVDESADTADAPATGQVLLRAEQMIADAAADLGRWYVLRLAGIYGPQRHYLLDQLRAGEVVIAGSGDYHLNLIHRDDIVCAICAALRQKTAPSGVYNLADDAPSTKLELVNWLATELGCEAPRFDPDLQTARMQRRGGRMPDRVILNQRAKDAFLWEPQYSTFKAGYRALLG